jgi:REP-associated tyrosine transposase
MKPFSITKDIDYYFCTDTIVGWQSVFMSLPFFETIIESYRYCQTNKGLYIHGYVIMPNHLHSILSAANNNLSDVLRDFKRFTSSKISDLLQETNNNRLLKYFSTAAERVGRGNDYKIWQSGSHPEAIVSTNFFLQKLSYIHSNPVRKGFVERPEYWLFSSARNYIVDDHSILKVDLIG